MELCDLYDHYGNPTGETVVRGEPIPEGRYRLVAGVLCQHTDGSILLVRRHPDKPTHPGLYEASASGSVRAGETALQAARRELLEETGILCNQLTPLYEESGANKLYRGFLARVCCDKDSVVLQEGETVAYLWASLEELAAMLRLQPSPVILHASQLRYLRLFV